MWVLIITTMLANSLSVSTISGLLSVDECFAVGHAYRLGNAGQYVTQNSGSIVFDCIQVR